jgi:hypothetical protein
MIEYVAEKVAVANMADLGMLLLLYSILTSTQVSAF